MERTKKIAEGGEEEEEGRGRGRGGRGGRGGTEENHTTSTLTVGKKKVLKIFLEPSWADLGSFWGASWGHVWPFPF